MLRRGWGPKFLGVLIVTVGLCALTAAMWWPVARALLGVEAAARGYSASENPDAVYLRDGSVRRGEVISISGSGLLLRADSEAAVETLGIKDIAEIDLGGRYVASMPRVPRIYFREGSVLVASPESIASADKDPVRFSLAGPVSGGRSPARSNVLGISFAEWCNPFTDAAEDMVCLRNGREIRGTIGPADAAGLHITKSAGGAAESVDYAKASTITFAERPAPTPAESPKPNCVVCVTDGSRLKGTLISLDGAKLELASPIVGKVTIERGAVTRIAFQQWAVEDEFPILVEDGGQTRIMAVSYEGIERVLARVEIPPRGRLVVSSTPCGTVFVGDEDGNAVYEMDADGRVLWRFDGAEKPTDAFRLASGNTLICDYGNDRVVEVTPGGKTVWSVKANGAMACSRLRNGNTLIVENYSGRVVEVDRSGNEVWAANGLDGIMDARRMDDGNTLALCGSEELRLSKINREGGTLWTVGGFSYPARIVACSQDRILICESAAGKLTILDNYGRRKRVIAIRPPQP